MISVVIPAHDEAAVIDRCLRTLLKDAAPGELEVVVVCNGCTDATEALARGWPVRVLSLPVASKIAALNLGDQAATGFPRFYADADIGLDVHTVREVAAVLRGGVLAASPGLDLRTDESTRWVRRYYRLWRELPSTKSDLVGRGVYAVSEAGRRRFGAFPDVIGDDHFVRSIFAPGERAVVHHARVVVQAPRTLRALVRRKARVTVGNRQVDALLGSASHAGRMGSGGLRDAIRRQPGYARDLPVYLAVALATRVVLMWDRRREQPSWGRDDSRVLAEGR
ncbi:MAG: glycosyltransferase [Egibacteraceae bacterium]